MDPPAAFDVYFAELNKSLSRLRGQLGVVHMPGECRLVDLRQAIQPLLSAGLRDDPTGRFFRLAKLDPMLYDEGILAQEFRVRVVSSRDGHSQDESNVPVLYARDLRYLDDIKASDYPPYAIHLLVLPVPDTEDRPNLAVNPVPPQAIEAIERYRPSFIQVSKWREAGRLDSVDYDLNHLYDYGTHTRLPQFVSDFKQKMDSTCFLHPADGWVRKLAAERTGVPDIFDSYADASPTVTLPSGTQSRRVADHEELTHVLYAMDRKWNKTATSFKERVTNPLLLDRIVAESDQRVIIKQGCDWPMYLVAENPGIADIDIRYRRYIPRSDLIFYRDLLPVFLIEQVHPPDEVRMQFSAMSVVRLGNLIRTRNNSVVVTMHITEKGLVKRRFLFQCPEMRSNHPNAVFYCDDHVPLQLTEPGDRAIFLLRVYNLLDMLRTSGGDGEDVVQEVEKMNREVQVAARTFGWRRLTSGKRALRDPEETGPPAPLPPGFVPRARVDEYPANIVPLRQSLNGMRRVAKQTREGSNELKILQFLAAMPGHENIISMLEFHAPWIILPEYCPFFSCLEMVTTFGKVTQICWGLIHGLMFLHKHLIAHRDIKPDNLVVDADCIVKFIDFDIAVLLKDENGEVRDVPGTEGCQAPEIIERRKPTYSPIKADRWSCGRVIKELLGLKAQTQDTAPLIQYSSALMEDNPENRPPLSEWPKWQAIDATMVPAKASARLRRRGPDTGEPRHAKKLKLGVIRQTARRNGVSEGRQREDDDNWMEN